MKRSADLHRITAGVVPGPGCRRCAPRSVFGLGKPTSDLIGTQAARKSSSVPAAHALFWCCVMRPAADGNRERIRGYGWADGASVVRG